MTEEHSFSFVFVCQAGRLEVDAVMLALSLRYFVTADYEMIAAVPTPGGVWGTPRRGVLEQLDRIGVRVVEIENRVDVDYPTGNKVGCLSIPTDMRTRLFLDSDVMCLAPFDGGHGFEQQFAAKPADLVTRGLDDRAWRAAYATRGLEPPTTRMRTTVSDEPIPPYFNAGVVSITDRDDFGEVWEAVCRAVDSEPLVQPKRPWLDQIALPIAVHELGLETALLTERHNYPAHLRRIEEREPPVFCHYHDPRNLARSAHGAEVIRRLGEEHPFIWDLVASEPVWRPVARLGGRSPRQRIGDVPGVRRAKGTVDRTLDTWSARRTPAPELARNVIVTGLPRSGTSLFSTLVNSVPNAVCLNEIGSPARTFRSFRSIRRRIGEGRPIANKYHASGELVTDTLPGDVRRHERPAEVVDDSFVLAQKFTLPFLNRLAELCELGISVWVVVRHPLDAIDSWKRCPPHFAIAGIDPPDPLLAHIPLPSGDLDDRRIAIWNHYAREIDRLRDRLEIVRYEDLVVDPGDAISRFCRGFELEPPEDLAGLDSRNRDRAAFDPEYLGRILAHCELDRFGYA